MTGRFFYPACLEVMMRLSALVPGIVVMVVWVACIWQESEAASLVETVSCVPVEHDAPQRLGFRA
jgi:hypothetical protein